MTNQLAAALFTLATLAAAHTASAQPSNCCQPQPLPQPPQQPQPQPQPVGQPDAQQTQPGTVAYAEPAQPMTQTEAPAAAAAEQDDEEGWHKPVGRRFMHGFRIGWTYIMHMDRARDLDGNSATGTGGREGESLTMKYGLKSPNMMLLGYEGFYRIVGHSWLNVLVVGNVTVAGLEQSKFIPAASGLIGFEIDQSFQLGVGVNLTPDPDAPSHMIAAAGWTPKVGSISTPVHFFFVPDTAGNHRMGATLGMSW